VLDFIFYYSQLGLALAKLLGVRFVPGKGLEGVIGRMLAQVIVYHNAKNYEFRDREQTKLSLLASELKDIETYSPELLAHFRNMYRLKRADYYGFRVEVATASFFIRRNVDFIKNESPDYVVNRPSGKQVFVECGSAHLDKPKNRSIGYKISSAVAGKIKLPYLNVSTALFVDITNVIHHTLVSGNYLDQSDIESIVKAEMSGKQIGATCLFFYMLDKDKDYFNHNSIRIDNEGIDPILLEFLDDQFPDDGDAISNYTIPHTG